MGKKKSKTGSAKRYGTRYGRVLREKIGAIEAEQKKKHKCPYCRAPRIKRLSIGIWNCTKCGKKFTGKAYTIAQKRRSVVVQEEKPKVKAKVEEEIEDVEEQTEEVVVEESEEQTEKVIEEE